MCTKINDLRFVLSYKEKIIIDLDIIVEHKGHLPSTLCNFSRVSCEWKVRSKAISFPPASDDMRSSSLPPPYVNHQFAVVEVRCLSE